MGAGLLLEASGDIAGALATVAALWDQCVRSGAALHCRGPAHDEVGLLAEAVEFYSRAPRPLELAVAAGRGGPG